MTTGPLQPVVECLSLSKVFKDFWGRPKVLAVDKLDLTIQPGEVFGLLGPNGSGKTTTIKILLGLLYPTSGRARIFDRPPTDTQIKSRIGFIPEESYLYRFLNASETLDYYGRLFRLDRVERNRRTSQLIDMVGLKKAARRPVGQYSKGMARRIGLAQALINDPDLLILDEPTTGLDPIGSRQIKDVIVELRRRGKTVILCSHLLGDVEDVCDRVAIMYGGRLQALGPVRQLLSRHEITQIRADRLDEQTVRKLRDIIERDAGRHVHAVEHPTDRLEDYFLRVVEKAQRERLETSGAESGRGVTEFLSAPAGTPERGRQIIEQLAAATAQPTAGDGRDGEPSGEFRRQVDAARADASARRSVLDSLVSVEPAPATDEAPQAPPPESKPEAKADRSVIERLTRGGP